MSLTKKFITCVILMLLVSQCAFAGDAVPTAIPTADYSLDGTVPDDIGVTGILEAWEKNISVSDEADALPLPILLRLLVTYCHDMSPSVQLSKLALYEPTMSIQAAEDVSQCLVDVLTINGHAHFTINAKTGELISSEGTADEDVQASQIGFDQVIEDWSKRFAQSDAWKSLVEVTEGEDALSMDVQLRLLITHYLDAYPQLTLESIKDFSPVFSIEDNAGENALKVDSFTQQGDVQLLINPKDGELITVSVNEGGNG